MTGAAVEVDIPISIEGKSDAVLLFVSFQSLKWHMCSVVKLRRKAPSGEKQQQGAHQKAKQNKEEQRKEKKRKCDSYNQPTCRLRSREARGTEIGQRFPSFFADVVYTF